MRTLGLCAALLLLAPACDKSGGPVDTVEPSTADEELGEGELSGQGPGGIASITSGMADAHPKVIEAEKLLAEHEATEALEVIEAAIAENPGHARFYLVQGNALTYLDRDEEARAAYEKAIELDPDDAMPHAALGNLVAFREGANLETKNEAVEHFQRALKLNPELAAAHQSLGTVLITLGRHQEAVEALENADRLDGNVETAYLLAQVHGELGNLDQALAHAKSALEFEPEASGVDLRLLYARLLMKKGQVEDAAREFERSAKLVPDSAPLRLEVARGLLELGKADAAMVHMQWLVEVAPQEIPVLVNLGRVLVAQGKAKEALAKFDAALAIQADSQAAQVYKIEALVAAKRCKEARELREALAKQLGWTKGASGELPRALAKAEGFLKRCK